MHGIYRHLKFTQRPLKTGQEVLKVVPRSILILLNLTHMHTARIPNVLGILQKKYTASIHV